MSILKKTIFSEPVTTIADAFEKSGLVWSAEQSEIMNTSTGKISNTKKSLYRSDTKEELGIVGLGYQPLQNTDAFSFFDVVCQNYGAQYNYVSEINGGSKIVLYASIPEPMQIKQGDDVVKGFMLTNSFDGTSSCEAHFMVNRLVCKNGLRMNVKGSSFKIKHSKNIQNRLAIAIDLYTKSLHFFETFQTNAQILVNKIVDKAMVEKFLDDVMGESESSRKENQKDKIIDLFEHGKGNNGTTAWDLYNGLTEWVDHYQGKDSDSREVNALIGRGADLKEHAFDAALSL